MSNTIDNGPRYSWIRPVDEGQEAGTTKGDDQGRQREWQLALSRAQDEKPVTIKTGGRDPFAPPVKGRNGGNPFTP